LPGVTGPFENAPPPYRRSSWLQLAPGITILTYGRRFIDKRYLGVRIGLHVGALTQEQAEERLQILRKTIKSSVLSAHKMLPATRGCVEKFSHGNERDRPCHRVKLTA
jgi:hypothetical protein